MVHGIAENALSEDEKKRIHNLEKKGLIERIEIYGKFYLYSHAPPELLIDDIIYGPENINAHKSKEYNGPIAKFRKFLKENK